MKALILVGGYGTRLRPLTFSVPKPLVPFVNKPICLHQIEALVKVGVNKIVLAVNVQPQALLDFCERTAAALNVSIVCSQETVPMGTAGPIYLAKQHLLEDDEPFFMLNSDVICEFPLQSMLDFHRAHAGEGTIMVTKVKDPSKYGVVVGDNAGRIERFVEKPSQFVGDEVNAGVYLFNTAVVHRVENKPTSIEREIFPIIAKDRALYSMVLPGHWADIGQPRDFLSGQALHLAYLRLTHPEMLATGANIVGNVLLDSTATVHDSAVLGPDVVIGPQAEVCEGARIQQTCVLDQVCIGRSTYVSNSILGWRSRIGQYAHISNVTFGENVETLNEVLVHTVMVCPHKTLSIHEFGGAGKIIM